MNDRSDRVIGTPVYVFSADDPANAKTGEKAETNSSRLQNALKAIKPLESAEAALQKALESLDKTGYEEIRNGINACLKHLQVESQKVLAQISGMATGQAAPQPAKPMAATASFVPTVDQIAGRAPLPGEKK